MGAVAPAPSRNHLLASLPSLDLERILPALELVPLVLKEYLHKPGARIEHVYFPAGGFCSVVTVLQDGRMVEVATVGREGAVGTFSGTNGVRPSSLVIVQAAAEACYRMPMTRFEQEVSRPGPFRTVLVAYQNALMGTIMQATACNAVHDVEQRLARWLLMAHDRVGADQFPLTQEFVAMMLGASRPTVTVVARGLQATGFITYHRGVVTIHDRKGLESASCECYRVITDELRAVTESSPSHDSSAE